MSNLKWSFLGQKFSRFFKISKSFAYEGFWAKLGFLPGKSSDFLANFDFWPFLGSKRPKIGGLVGWPIGKISKIEIFEAKNQKIF